MATPEPAAEPSESPRISKEVVPPCPVARLVVSVRLTPAVPVAAKVMTPPLLKVTELSPSAIAAEALPLMTNSPPARVSVFEAVEKAVAPESPSRLESALVVLSSVNVPPAVIVSVAKPILAEAPSSVKPPLLTVRVPSIWLLLSAVVFMTPVPILVTLSAPLV